MDMAVARGGTAGVGFKHFYREAMIVARMLIGHLNGSVDIGTLAINSTLKLRCRGEPGCRGRISLALNSINITQRLVKQRAALDDRPLQ